MIDIISSGSTGNCVLYFDSVMVDVGVPYAYVSKRVKDVRLILLTHEHKDHINISTIKKIQLERPGIRIGCCDWMLSKLVGVRNVDVYEIGKTYDYGTFSVSPVQLYHDVPNCGYRIFSQDKKIFHATDTAHLSGIEAKGYDLYAIECNYDGSSVFEEIKNAKESGSFCYKEGAVNSHLSEQQAYDFFFRNKKEGSKIVRLHESKIK